MGCLKEIETIPTSTDLKFEDDSIADIRGKPISADCIADIHAGDHVIYGKKNHGIIESVDTEASTFNWITTTNSNSAIVEKNVDFKKMLVFKYSEGTSNENEKAVEVARSALSSYPKHVNNSEQFATWCKTGVHAVRHEYAEEREWPVIHMEIGILLVKPIEEFITTLVVVALKKADWTPSIELARCIFLKARKSMITNLEELVAKAGKSAAENVPNLSEKLVAETGEIAAENVPNLSQKLVAKTGEIAAKNVPYLSQKLDKIKKICKTPKVLNDAQTVTVLIGVIVDFVAMAVEVYPMFHDGEWSDKEKKAIGQSFGKFVCGILCGLLGQTLIPVPFFGGLLGKSIGRLIGHFVGAYMSELLTELSPSKEKKIMKIQ